jgi:N6-L-threonylcarbamoyladenine synthase/protein kinase Bud32
LCPASELIYRGAEAEVRRTDYLGQPAVEKRRVEKGYRIREIDSCLRRERTKSECKAIIDARACVGTPTIYDVDMPRASITMEYVDGRKVKDLFAAGNTGASRQIGRAVAALHSAGIIHGDLTTSNMLLKGKKLYFVDFGLSYRSAKVEDIATDLLVFKKMLASTHYRHFGGIWRGFLAGYAAYAGAKKALAKLAEIEKRARYAER